MTPWNWCHKCRATMTHACGLPTGSKVQCQFCLRWFTVLFEDQKLQSECQRRRAVTVRNQVRAKAAKLAEEMREKAAVRAVAADMRVTLEQAERAQGSIVVGVLWSTLLSAIALLGAYVLTSWLRR